MHEWHICRKSESPKAVRRYRHVSKMFQFVLRNPAMFKDRTLTVYNNGVPVTDVSWKEIQTMVYAGYKEGSPAGQVSFPVAVVDYGDGLKEVNVELVKELKQ